MVTADHGPAVSGAHNTIVTARAGKDLVSCLTSGLLTIVRFILITHSERCMQALIFTLWSSTGSKKHMSIFSISLILI